MLISGIGSFQAYSEGVGPHLWGWSVVGLRSVLFTLQAAIKKLQVEWSENEVRKNLATRLGNGLE